MAQRIDRNARAKIQISAALLRDQPRAFAFDKGKRRTVIGGQNGRDHDRDLSRESQGLAKAKGGSQRKCLEAQGKRDQTSAVLASGTGDKGGPVDHAAVVSAKCRLCKVVRSGGGQAGFAE